MVMAHIGLGKGLVCGIYSILEYITFGIIEDAEEPE